MCIILLAWIVTVVAVSQIDLVMSYSLNGIHSCYLTLSDGRNVDDYFKDTFPMLSQAQYSEAVLFPGDMLFIPRHMWHFIISIDETTAMEWNNIRSNQFSSAPVMPKKSSSSDVDNEACKVGDICHGKRKSVSPDLKDD